MSDRVGDDEVDDLVHKDDGAPLLSVGRDRSTPEKARLVRLDLADQSLLMGPRYALAVSEALARHAIDLLTEEGAMAAAATSTKH